MSPLVDRQSEIISQIRSINSYGGGITRSAVLAARDTERQCNNISSKMTSLVSSIPIATIARLSPTRTISIPAASAT